MQGEIIKLQSSYSSEKKQQDKKLQLSSRYRLVYKNTFANV